MLEIIDRLIRQEEELEENKHRVEDDDGIDEVREEAERLTINNN